MKKANKEEKLDPPKATSGDSAHLLTKVVLSPILGASELFELFITPPLQKRTQKWMEDIVDEIRKHGVMLDALQNNERFITIMLQASTIAVRSHQREKLTALKNVVMNSALGCNVGEDFELIFVRFVDELTPTHLYLLKCFVDNEDELKSLKSYPEVYQLLISKDTRSISQDEFKMLIGDLATRGLIWISPDIEDFEDIYQVSSILDESTKDDLPRIIITDIAKKFMTFISFSLGA